MIELDNDFFIFKNKVVYYSDNVFDVKGYDSISFRAMQKCVNNSTFAARDEVVYTIDLTLDLETIWGNMNRNVHRNIKKAEQSGVKIKFNQGYEDFYKMYKDHLNVKKHIRWFNVHKLEAIKKSGTLVVAEYDSKIISGSVFLEDRDHLLYWITASYRYSDDKALRQISGNATHLIHWEIIKYAKSKGLKEYNLGSCATNDLSNELLVQFKESLGGKPVRYNIYNKDYNLLVNYIRKCYPPQQP
jgi:lipid II:glycine glycyltransferase (peptidoglycan interpeptide bridge formation enzyme)